MVAASLTHYTSNNPFVSLGNGYTQQEESNWFFDNAYCNQVDWLSGKIELECSLEVFGVDVIDVSATTVPNLWKD